MNVHVMTEKMFAYLGPIKKLFQDRSCPICALTKTDHRVKHITEFHRSGSVTSSFTFRSDGFGNIWRVDYNRRCARCGHIWYVPIGLREWDEVRLAGPQLVSTPGERVRIDAYHSEHGHIPMDVYSRIVFQERAKAGFIYKNGIWVRNTAPPR